MTSKVYPAIFCVFIAIFIYIASRFDLSLIKKCDTNKCPLCYGTDMCKSIETSAIVLDYSSFEKTFNNLFSVKNVFYGKYMNAHVVLKKLGQDEELVEVLTIVKTLSTNKYREFLTNSVIDSFYKRDDENVKNFHVCNLETAEFLLDVLYKKGLTLEQIWTIKQVNVEPLILQVFDNEKGWPVPKYYGACGRVIVESYCGLGLNSFRDHLWKERAIIAINILNAAEDFTTAHEVFSFYLTDISPDNIAVDDDLNVYFVDLENGVLKMRNNETKTFGTENHHHHHSNYFGDESYMFSMDDICSQSLSDHNIYSVCKLLLSPKAPWPMMKGGLLHSPPSRIKDHDLFKYIDLCVDSDDRINRFAVMKVIVDNLKELLNID